MPRELEPWGGELRMPGWLRWMLRRGPAPDDSAERVHERRNAETTVETPLMAIDRAIFGPFSEAYPDKRAPRRR
ncbi:MAG TPA: hypothetical protein VFN44_25905 [Solirubrobacteraceae bacterium]|nr:hypothetical protein [Solirubrobacteraceae bacterium]